MQNLFPRAALTFSEFDALVRAVGPRIAVLVACHNEVVAIAGMVQGFAVSLPGSTSTTTTHRRHRGGGARGGAARNPTGHGQRCVPHVRRSRDQHLRAGRRRWHLNAGTAPAMVHLLMEDGLDMVNATRVDEAASAYRPGHRLSNAVLSGIVASLFGREITDMLSSYWVFSRRFVNLFESKRCRLWIRWSTTISL